MAMSSFDPYAGLIDGTDPMPDFPLLTSDDQRINREPTNQVTRRGYIMYTITDQLADNRAAVQCDSDIVPTILPWFPDAPDEVLDVLDDLAAALVRGEPTRELEAYLAVSITREPAPVR